MNKEWWNNVFGENGENINIVSDDTISPDTISVDLKDITVIDFIKNTDCDMTKFTIDKSEINTNVKELKLIMEFNFSDITLYTPVDLNLECHDFAKSIKK